MAFSRNTTIGGMVAVTVIVALLLGGIFVYNKRCPQCGAFFAMEQVSKVKTGEKRVSKTERRDGRRREVTVNRTYYTVTDKCKKCGFVKTYETHSDSKW